MEWHEILPSTNDSLKQRAIDGAPAGTVLVARSQTRGRGRYERTFFSPDKGLYFSVLLRPNACDVTSCGQWTAMGAVAVCRAMEALGFSPKIKWVNDVYLDGKKACGILAESAFGADGRREYVVLGIGVNVVMPKGGFAPEIASSATAMYHRGGYGKVKKLLVKILDEMSSLILENDVHSLLNEYRARSFLIGREVQVVEGRCQGNATVLGISDEFGLIVDAGEKQVVLDGGEVSIKI